ARKSQDPRLAVEARILNPKAGWEPADAGNLDQRLPVLKQFPEPGAWVLPKTAVVCFLKPPGAKPDEPKPVRVPPLEKLRGDEARAAVENLGLGFDPRVPGKAGGWEKPDQRTLREYTVLRQDPPSGEWVPPKTTVVCYLRKQAR